MIKLSPIKTIETQPYIFRNWGLGNWQLVRSDLQSQEDSRVWGEKKDARAPETEGCGSNQRCWLEAGWKDLCFTDGPVHNGTNVCLLRWTNVGHMHHWLIGERRTRKMADTKTLPEPVLRIHSFIHLNSLSNLSRSSFYNPYFMDSFFTFSFFFFFL